MRDIGMVLRRTLEQMQRKGDVFEGGGGEETDNVAPTCLWQHNSMIIFADVCVGVHICSAAGLRIE